MSYSESQTKLLWENPTSVVYEKKLDTALRDTVIRLRKTELLNEQYPNLNFDTKILLHSLDTDELLDSATDNSCYGMILRSIYETVSYQDTIDLKLAKRLTRSYQLAKDNLQFQHAYSMSSNKLHVSNKSTVALRDKCNGLHPTLLMSNIMTVSHKFRCLIDKIGHMKRKLPMTMSDDEKIAILAKEGIFRIDQIGLEIHVSLRTCFIKCSQGGTFWMPNEYILLIHNKLSDLISVLLLAQYQENVCHPNGTMKIVEDYVQELTRLSIKYKDKFANISGNLEGIIVAEILLLSEEWVNDSLLNEINLDLISSINYNYRNSKLRTIILQAPIPLMNELGCLSKLLGHPFVDMKKGAEKLHKRTTEVKELTYESVSWVVNKAKETFVKNYIARHNKWPLCSISMMKPGRDPLLQAMLKNKSPDNPKIINDYGVITIDDWARLDLEKIMEFQSLDNIIPYLKDKSISVLRNKVFQMYIRNEGNKAPHKWEETRLLLYYLLNPLKKIDHQQFLEEYAKTEDLATLADYLIIRLVPKEKEHKIAFRGFGVKSYLDRARNLAQEKNTAKFLNLYCDEQSMTMGEIDISKRLYAYRTILKAYSGYKVLYVNFDSSGWNNCFRKETVNPIMRETLAKIFGNDVIARIHEAYENSLFYIPDGDSTYYWEGQQGGIDGLNQYAWVWVYINQIKYAMKDLPVKYHMFCKGDDMRLAVMIHPKLLEVQDMKGWHAQLVNQVNIVAKEFGHEIKVQESYGSENYFTFSKCSSLGTIELPQGFRKIQKVYGANNAIIAVLDEYIASSFSNAHSASRYMTNTYSAYFTALVWSYWQLSSSSYYTECTDIEMMSLLLIPNMLGGFPIIYLHNMRVRAESDLLSPFIAMLQFSRKYNMILFRTLKHFMRHTVYKTGVTSTLYRDPYCLNIKIPILPLSKLRSYMLPALKRRVRNSDIKELIKASQSVYSKSVIKCLTSAQPQNVKILSTIYSATPEGVLGELLRKFESGRSILDLILLRKERHKGDQILRTVISSERNLQQWRYKKISGDHLPQDKNLLIYDLDAMCPTEIAQKLRDTTWKTTITGISMPPLAHQLILVVPSAGMNDKHAQLNHFKYNYTIPHRHLHENCSPHWSVADITPFLGYTTRTGNIAPTVSFQDKDPLIIKLKNLLDLLSWVMISKTNDNGDVINSNIEYVIKNVISTYTNLTSEEMSPFTATRKSGTVQHHARAPRFKESIVPNILSNSYQNVSGNSDSHITLVNSSMHYTINFLHVMCESFHQIQIEMEVCNELTPPREIWGVTTNCNYCSTPINEEPIVVDLAILLNVSTNQLNACRIENISKKMILHSYQDFQESAFKNIDADSAPDNDLAISAVAHEFIYHHIQIHNKLQSRFTQHAMTRDAKNTLVNLTHATTSRDIGFSEIKRLRYIDIAEALISPIFQFIMIQIKNFTADSLLALLQKIHSYELPWYDLMTIVHKAGKLGGFIHWLKRVSNIHPPACFENPTSASPYIGFAIYNWVILTGHSLNVTIRTYLSREQISDIVLNMFLPYQFRWLNQHFIHYTKQWTPNTDDDKLKLAITRRGFYICFACLDEDSLVQDLTDNWLQNEFNTIDLVKYISIDADTIEILIEDPLSDNNKMYQWLRSSYSSWLWDDILEEVITTGIDTEAESILLKELNQEQLTVGVTDVASAINVLRANPHATDIMNEVKYDSQSSEQESSHKSLNLRDISYYNLNIKTSKNVYSSNIPIVSQNMINNNDPVLFMCNEVDFSYDKIVLDQSYSYKIYGSETSSQSKLDYVMHVMSVRYPLPDMIHCLCCGEGYGGFIEYLSTCTSYSIFVYNTLPDRVGGNIFPVSALDSLIENNNKVDTNAVDVGIYDLSTDECRDILIKHGTPYSIVTCDADVSWKDRSMYQKLAYNVCSIYLLNSVYDGILIFKSNLGWATIITDCVGELKRWCDNVVVIRCPNSNIGGEVYICANKKHSMPIDISQFLFKAHIMEYRSFDAFCTRISKENDLILNSDQSINMFPHLHRSLKNKFSDLQCSATSKILNRLSIDIDIKELVNQSHYYEDVLNKINEKVISVRNLLYDIVKNMDSYKLQNVAYHQNTRTHRLMQAMRFLTLSGAAYGLEIAMGHRVSNKRGFRIVFIMNLDYLNQIFKNCIKPTTNLYLNTYMMHDTKFLSPYLRFMEGFRVIQMICGYLHHSPLRFQPRINLNDVFEDCP
jgi:hypothetical protein